MVDARIENRNHARHDFLTAIEYILDHPANSNKLHKGVIINVASKGLGVYIIDQLNTGQKIIIKKGLSAGYQLAEVCWIRQETSYFCRAGLKLLNSTP